MALHLRRCRIRSPSFLRAIPRLYALISTEKHFCQIHVRLVTASFLGREPLLETLTALNFINPSLHFDLFYESWSWNWLADHMLRRSFFLTGCSTTGPQKLKSGNQGFRAKRSHIKFDGYMIHVNISSVFIIWNCHQETKYVVELGDLRTRTPLSRVSNAMLLVVSPGPHIGRWFDGQDAARLAIMLTGRCFLSHVHVYPLDFSHAE